MVGDVRVADRAKIDRIGGAQPGQPVRRHETAVLAVPVGAPVIVVDGQPEATVARRHGVQHFQAGTDHLGADAISRDGGDAVFSHRLVSFFPDVSNRAIAGNSAQQQVSETICANRRNSPAGLCRSIVSPGGTMNSTANPTVGSGSAFLMACGELAAP